MHNKAAIGAASVLEPLLKARGAIYDALKTREIPLDKPEENYTIIALLNVLLEAWDKDRELAESCRDTWKHRGGAEVFGE